MGWTQAGDMSSNIVDRESNIGSSAGGDVENTAKNGAIAQTVHAALWVHSRVMMIKASSLMVGDMGVAAESLGDKAWERTIF